MSADLQSLPPRRPSETFEAVLDALSDGSPRFVLTVSGVARQGRVHAAEVFANCNKLTSPLDIAARDCAILISLALQAGLPLAALASAMSRNEQGVRQGLGGFLCDELMACEARWNAGPPPWGRCNPSCDCRHGQCAADKAGPA